MGPRARPAHAHQGLRHGHGPQRGGGHHRRAVPGRLLRWTGIWFLKFSLVGDNILPLQSCPLLALAGSAISNGREPKSCLGRVFNFKLGRFA